MLLDKSKPVLATLIAKSGTWVRRRSGGEAEMRYSVGVYEQ